MILWQSDEKTLGKNPHHDYATVMNWLIDGQQRIIILEKTWAGNDGIEVVFNPNEGNDGLFSLSNAATRHDQNWIHICDIWNDQAYRQIRKNYIVKALRMANDLIIWREFGKYWIVKYHLSEW